MFDKNGYPLYKQKDPEFAKAMKTQYQKLNIPIEFDPSIKAMAMLRENKQAASKEDIRRGYSPVGDFERSAKFGLTDASSQNQKVDD